MRVENRPDGNRDVLGAPSVYSDTTGHGKVAHLSRRRQVRRHLEALVGPANRCDCWTPSGDKIPLKPGQTWVLLAG